MPVSTRALRGFFAAALAALSGCSPRAADSYATELPVYDIAKLPGSVFQVNWSGDTVVIDPPTVRKALRGISPDHMFFLFDSSSEPIRRLAPGKIVFLQGLALRKVVRVTPAGGSQVEVETQSASLADAISEGTVKFNYPVRFGSRGVHGRLTAPGTGPFPGLSFFSPPSVFADPGDAPTTLNETFGDWKCSIVATPSFDRVEINSTFTRQVQNITFVLTASGYLANFETTYDLVVKDRGNWKFLDWTNKNMNGALTFAFSSYYDGTGPMTGEQRLSFTIPASIAPVPASLSLAGLPISVNFGGAILFRPGFTGKGELMKGKFEVHYNGVEGISLSAGHSSPSGEIHGDEKIIEAPALSAIGPEGMINGLAMPRIELSFESSSLINQVAKALPTYRPAPIKGLVQKAEKQIVGSAFKSAQDAVDQAQTAANGGKPLTADQAGHFSVDLKSSADLYAEVVIVASIVSGGALTSLGLPCEKVQLLTTGKVGMKTPPVLGGLTLFTKTPEPMEVEVFKHGTTQAHGCRNE
jgi:hypothetical protein